METTGDPTGHPSLETTVVSPVVGLEPDPAIAEYTRGFEAVGRDVGALLAGLSDAQLNWRPSEGRWSIAECIAHLTTTGSVYLPPLDRAIERGQARAMFGGRDFQPGLIGRWFIAQMEPPPRRRMKAPRKIIPQRVESGARLSTEFQAMNAELMERVRRATNLDLSRVKLNSPLLPVLRLSLGTCFGIVLAHERRHLWQARQVRQELRFPG
jgi:hypothetical protein